MLRVLRPGGRLAILEFGLPVVPAVRPLYLWYFNHVLPRIGQTLAQNDQGAYNYLPASVGRFPQAEAHYFTDAGHYLFEDALEDIAPLISRFLEHNLQVTP